MTGFLVFLWLCCGIAAVCIIAEKRRAGPWSVAGCLALGPFALRPALRVPKKSLDAKRATREARNPAVVPGDEAMTPFTHQDALNAAAREEIGWFLDDLACASDDMIGAEAFADADRILASARAVGREWSPATWAAIAEKHQRMLRKAETASSSMRKRAADYDVRELSRGLAAAEKRVKSGVPPTWDDRQLTDRAEELGDCWDDATRETRRADAGSIEQRAKDLRLALARGDAFRAAQAASMKVLTSLAMVRRHAQNLSDAETQLRESAAETDEIAAAIRNARVRLASFRASRKLAALHTMGQGDREAKGQQIAVQAQMLLEEDWREFVVEGACPRVESIIAEPTARGGPTAKAEQRSRPSSYSSCDSTGGTHSDGAGGV